MLPLSDLFIYLGFPLLFLMKTNEVDFFVSKYTLLTSLMDKE